MSLVGSLILFQFIFLSFLTLLFPLSFLPALLSFFLMSTKTLGLLGVPLGLALVALGADEK